MSQVLSSTPAVASPRTRASRPACSDAERRLAQDTARALRSAGRRADVRTTWVRRGATFAGLISATGGLVASLLASTHAIAATAVAGVALLSLLLDAGGRLRPLRWLVPRRATEAVVSPPTRGGGAGAIDLLLVVRTDVPKRGLMDRGVAARWGLGPERILAVNLLLLTVVCGARIAGADGIAVDIVQMIVSVGVLLGGAGLLDRALATTTAQDVARADTALAVAQTVLEDLDAIPPRRLATTLVLCGAGAQTLRPILREQRRAGVASRDVVVVEIAPAPGGTPVWWKSDGRVLPLRFHPTALQAAREAGEAQPRAAARAIRGVGDGPARAARGMRRPAAMVGCPDQAAGIAFVLAFIRRLDTALIEGR
jgi:hypothetical protein